MLTLSRAVSRTMIRMPRRAFNPRFSSDHKWDPPNPPAHNDTLEADQKFIQLQEKNVVLQERRFDETMHRLKMHLSNTTVQLLVVTEEFHALGLLDHISSAHYLTIHGLLNDNPSPQYYSARGTTNSWLTDIAQHPKFQIHLQNACAAFKQRPSDVSLDVNQVYQSFSPPFHDNYDGSLSVHVDYTINDAVAYAAVCSWLSSVDLLPVLGIRFQHFELGEWTVGMTR
ncbi:hypothetical protein B0H14DRAFT_2820551 [Mycena olivaceomarginata]|nr:hypothetical protein B0H14DRAFT_2820551 [Mycena olivaceomarginata]